MRLKSMLILIAVTPLVLAVIAVVWVVGLQFERLAKGDADLSVLTAMRDA